MSGLFKGIKKVFKKVAKVVKRIAPIALAAGAVLFTAGAALGVPAMAGGWGAAVTKGLGALGLSGTSGLAGALTGALTQAGYGAALGGFGSLAAGGDFVEGAQMGALAGAATGGIMGGLGMPVDPLKGIGTGGAEVTSAATPSTATLPDGVAAPAGVPPGVPQPTGLAPSPGTAVATPGTAPVAGPAVAQPTVMNSIAENPITGHVVKGIGGALLMGSEGDAARDDRQARAASYRMTPGAAGLRPNSGGRSAGLLPPSEIYPMTTGRQAEEAVSGTSGARRPSYRYDPITGTIQHA